MSSGIWFLDHDTVAALIVGTTPPNHRTFPGSMTCRALVLTRDGLAGLLEVRPGSLQAEEAAVASHLEASLRALANGQLVPGVRWAPDDIAWADILTNPEGPFAIENFRKSAAFYADLQLRLGALARMDDVLRERACSVALQVIRDEISRLLDLLTDRARLPPRLPLRALTLLRLVARRRGLTAEAWIEQALVSMPLPLLMLAVDHPEGERLREAICCGTSIYRAFEHLGPGWVLRCWLRAGNSHPAWACDDIVTVLACLQRVHPQIGPRTGGEWSALVEQARRVAQLPGPPAIMARHLAAAFTCKPAAGETRVVKFCRHVDALMKLPTLLRTHIADVLERDAILVRIYADYNLVAITEAVEIHEAVVEDKFTEELGVPVTELLEATIQLAREVLPTASVAGWRFQPPRCSSDLLSMASLQDWCVSKADVALRYLLDGELFVLIDDPAGRTYALATFAVPGPGEGFSNKELRGAQNGPVSSECQIVCKAYANSIPDSDDADIAISRYEEYIRELKSAIRLQKLRRMATSPVSRILIDEVGTHSTAGTVA